MTPGAGPNRTTAATDRAGTMDDVLREFLTETAESLDVLDGELVKLEQGPNDPELIGNIFRLLHTIKGTCGFLGLPRLESVAHAGENILGKLRDGELDVTPGAIGLVLEALDCIKSILSALEATEVEPPGEDSDLIARLEALTEGASTPPENAEVTAEAFMAPLSVASAVGEVDAQPAGSDGAGYSAQPESSLGSHSIRVNLGLLENLMATVSELVLLRNQLQQVLRLREESDFAAALHRLDHITSALQDGVMRTRMQPIANAWSKLPRLVRELSRELGKKIELKMVGGETELDRQILEIVKDPLTHMVRNAADHGLESLEERVKVGKPEFGTIKLAAHQEGGHIAIIVSDDGRGLSIERIKEKAATNRLHSNAELSNMSDQQVMQLIFNAGLSTAEKITSISGRGVGMDVVKSNIEKIGGSIDINSTLGKGATFTVKIPLTMAIISALIVEVRGERFAIPQIGVSELVHASPKSEHKVEFINGVPLLRLRNRLLPLVSLADLLKLEGGRGSAGEILEDSLIVVAQVGIASLGIIVDRVYDTEEIVVKPLARILRDIRVFSGNTILGDGHIVMILDLNGIANAASDFAAVGEDFREIDRPGRERDARTQLLVFKAGGNAHKAVPLSLVRRLEEIDAKTIEYSESGSFVQYRGQLMPLVPIERNQSPKKEGRCPVIVIAAEQRVMGLLVDEIVDVVDDRLKIELASARPGLIGTAIIEGRVSDVIDTGYYLEKAHPGWFASGRQGNSSLESRARILLIDDSPFFRNLLMPLLNAAGYDVTPVENADRAFNLHDSGHDFDIIVSDVELPGMSGYELAEAIRKSSRWRNVPLVALSRHRSSSERNRSQTVGFLEFAAKMDGEALLQKISEVLEEHRGAA